MKLSVIVDRIELFLNQRSPKVYDRPALKFIREFLAGIMVAQSTVLADVALYWREM